MMYVFKGPPFGLLWSIWPKIQSPLVSWYDLPTCKVSCWLLKGKWLRELKEEQQFWAKANHTINRAAFVCLSVCLFVPYLLRGPLTDLRQTWWVHVGGPRNCPWGVLFRKGQRVDGSTGHFRFPLYYIYASLTPHSCKRRLCCYSI